jgi:putrescine transport system substrate-binding protein
MAAGSGSPAGLATGAVAASATSTSKARMLAVGRMEASLDVGQACADGSACATNYGLYSRQLGRRLAMETRHRIVAVCIGLVAACIASPALASDAKPGGNLFVFNWSDYIGEETIAKFEAETGIKVTYDVFDSNEVLEARLMAGASGFDIVVPTADFLGRQIAGGVFQPLDRSKLPNFANLDPVLMAQVAENDPDNRPRDAIYLWGTTGIGFNVDKVEGAPRRGRAGGQLGAGASTRNTPPSSRIAASPCSTRRSEMIPAALKWLGLDPKSIRHGRFRQGRRGAEGGRPHVRYFHSSQYINDLANGDICVAVGWSGDVFQARDRAAEASAGVTVDYRIPKEGAHIWFDMMAIPSDARHPENAHAFIDFLLRPEIMAEITDYVVYRQRLCPQSKPLMDEEIADDPAVYPRQVHAAAHAGRLRGAQRGAHRDRRPGHGGHPALSSGRST